MADETVKTGGAEPWKGRKLIRGQWRDPEGEIKRGSQRVNKPISVKLTEAELAAFDEQVAKAGLTRNRALRIAARRVGGFLEVDDAVLDALVDIRRQITGIARNINQIARIANMKGDPRLDVFLTERQLLGTELARTEGLMRQVLEIGRRRTDGLSLLEGAEQVSDG